MNKYVYIASIALCSSALAQNQNPDRVQLPGDNRPKQPVVSEPSLSTGNRATQGLKNAFTQWRVEELPAAVQKTINEQSGGQHIADIDREDRSGQTIWEVEFEREGKNPKVHIADDGRLLTGHDASVLNKDNGPILGVGSPAGAQTGRVKTGLGTSWEDLPQAVQQKAMQYGGKDKTKDIDLKQRYGRNVYALEFEREGRNLEVSIAEDGTVVRSNDATAAPVQTPPAGELGRTPATRPLPQNEPGRNLDQPRP